MGSKQLDNRSESSKSIRHITVWDLPSWAKRSQVFETVRYLGRIAHIEMIKEAYNKTRAQIEFVLGTVNIRELEETGVYPL